MPLPDDEFNYLVKFLTRQNLLNVLNGERSRLQVLMHAGADARPATTPNDLEIVNNLIARISELRE
jgi:hypothetical protein